MPETRGSSEKYSKFLPQSTFLWIFIPGASRTSVLFFFISLPVTAASSSTASVFHVQASAVPHGKREVYFLILIPAGPSVVIMGGTPLSRRPWVIPPKAPALPVTPKALSISPSPLVRAASSLLSSWAINSSRVISPFFTDASFLPL